MGVLAIFNVGVYMYKSKKHTGLCDIDKNVCGSKYLKYLLITASKMCICSITNIPFYHSCPVHYIPNTFANDFTLGKIANATLSKFR